MIMMQRILIRHLRGNPRGNALRIAGVGKEARGGARGYAGEEVALWTVELRWR